MPCHACPAFFRRQKKPCTPRPVGGEIHGMSFPFHVPAGRALWVTCGVAAMLCVAEAPAAAQAFFPSPDDKVSPQPWQERGLRAALADASPEVHALAVGFIVERKWVTRFLGFTELRHMLQSPERYSPNMVLVGLAQFGPEAALCAGEILPLLHHEAEWTRQATAEALGQMGREVVPHAKEIVPLLRDQESLVRDAAVQALGRLGSLDAAAVVPLLQPLLADTASAAERAAAKREGHFGASSPTNELVTKQDRLRRCAVQALGRMGAAGAPLAAPLLQPLLQDADEDVQREAERALETLTKAAPASVAEALEKTAQAPAPPSPERLSALISQLRAPAAATRSAAMQALAQAGRQTPPQVISALLPLLQGADFTVACSAAAVLQKAGREAAACRKVLLPLLKSPDAAARRLAVETLKAADAGPESAAVVLPALLPLLKEDPDENVQFVAADVFHEWGAVAAPYVEDLLRLLNDNQSSDHLRICTMHALAGAGMQEADTVVPALRSVFSGSSGEVKEYAVHDLETMAEKHAPAATTALRHLLKDPDSSVRSHAVRALDHLGSDTTTHLQDLLPLLKDPSSMVRCHAFMALRAMGPQAAPALAPELLPLLLQPGGPMQPSEVAPDGMGGIGVRAAQLPLAVVVALQEAGRGTEPAAYQAMLAVLRQASEDFERREAAEFLTPMGPLIPTYAKDLLPLLQDPDFRVRSHALDALRGTPPKDAPMVARALLPLLQHAEGDVKYDLINTLGHLGPAAVPVALPALLPLLKDPDTTVRMLIAGAMGSMGAAAAPHAAPHAADLQPLLQDPEMDVQVRTVLALGSMGPQALPVLVQALPRLLREDQNLDDAVRRYDLKRATLIALKMQGKTAAPPLIQALLPLLQHPESEVRFRVMDVLDDIGPFTQSPNWQCAALAIALGFSEDEHTQALRFHLYLWSGPDDALLLSVRWLGKPAADPMLAYGRGLDAAEQQAVLGMLLRLWPHSVPHPALRQEMAGRIADVAQSISAVPEEKVAALLKNLDAALKADAVAESQEASAKAREVVEKVTK
jgi:HEAT repeat protein